MAINLLEEQLEAVKHQKMMYNWKKDVESDEVIIKELDKKIKTLHNEEIRLLKELGIQVEE